ncbi:MULTISPECIES: hypothetical protein [unclassified Acinetobacter]|uniref:hypothetical protein n=1 Tax=unclassified Acinetobacter TaxID=196816 RepID=UPI0035B73C94
MNSIISKVMTTLQSLYQQAEDFIEEEREIPVSENMLNGVFKRYVTDNVELLKDLHADLHDDWLRLYATVDVAGIYAEVFVDLKLLEMEMNQKKQLLIFEQISPTHIVESRFESSIKKMGVKTALFVCNKILKRDPLGLILGHYKIVQEKHGLLYLDLSRWLGDLEIWKKCRVNHATVQDNRLLVLTNLNLDAILEALNPTKKSDEEDPANIPDSNQESAKYDNHPLATPSSPDEAKQSV